MRLVIKLKKSIDVITTQGIGFVGTVFVLKEGISFIKGHRTVIGTMCVGRDEVDQITVQETIDVVTLKEVFFGVPDCSGIHLIIASAIFLQFAECSE